MRKSRTSQSRAGKGRTRKGKPVPSPDGRRLRALEKRRRVLQERIERARSALAECEREQREFVHRVVASAMPIFESCHELDMEIHRLFAEIFQTRKLGERSRRQIVRIYESLQLDGMLTDQLSEVRSEWLDDDPELGDSELDGVLDASVDRFDDPFADPASDRDAPGGGDRTGPDEFEWTTSEPRQDRRLRAVFLRLASTFHPDFAQDQATRARHTEVMKELNRAYREGDAASLLDMEQELEQGREAVVSTDDGEGDPDRARAERVRLEGHVSLLHEQLDNLKGQVDEARNSQLGQLLADMREVGRGLGLEPSDVLVGEFREHLDDLQELRDFVHRFRHREMTIKAFIRGPARGDDDDLFERLRLEVGDNVRHTPDGW